MSRLTENIYNIKDLYLIKFASDYMNKLEQDDDGIRYFNQSLKFIVDRFQINKGKELPYYFESYTECITGQDLYKRESQEEFKDIPDIFESIEEFPIEYLDEEEKKIGKVTTMRLFQIFQEINIKSKTLTKTR